MDMAVGVARAPAKVVVGWEEEDMAVAATAAAVRVVVKVVVGMVEAREEVTPVAVGRAQVDLAQEAAAVMAEEMVEVVREVS